MLKPVRLNGPQLTCLPAAKSVAMRAIRTALQVTRCVEQAQSDGIKDKESWWLVARHQRSTP